MDQIQKEAKDLTLEDLEAMCQRIADQRDEVARIAQEKNKAAATLESLESRFLEVLVALDRKNFQSAKHGMFYITGKSSVKTPKTDEEKTAFFNYLREKGGEALVLKYMTVNSQSLNAFYKEEFDLAKERGEAMDFTIPGVGEPTIVPSLGIRKAK